MLNECRERDFESTWWNARDLAKGYEREPAVFSQGGKDVLLE